MKFSLRVLVMIFACALISVTARGLSSYPLDSKENFTALPDECRLFKDHILPGYGWKGGFVEVPQDWQNPKTSRKIKVFYFYDALRDIKTATPILFLNGGPFASYHGRMPEIHRQMSSYDSDRNHVLVMMDQRGTGCSVPLVPEADQPLQVEMLAKYSTDDVIRDAELIRKSLFPNRSWKIFAQSYGGFLSARYMHLFPDSIRSVHVHAPVFHRTMEEFFRFRILRQNEVLHKFLDFYHGQGLERAIEKISSEEGQHYCVEAHATSPKLCGRVLLDAILASIGQGKGRDIGTTEIWNAVRESMFYLMISTTDPADHYHKQFVAAAEDSLAFFRNPTSIVVFTLWAQELQLIDGNPVTDCDAAYENLRRGGVDVENLPLDECRIIKQAFSASYGQMIADAFLKIDGKEKQTQTDILDRLAISPIPFYLSTGELDSLVQTESLQELIKSPLVRYTHFNESGHAGWLFEPLVWRDLIGVKAK